MCAMVKSRYIGDKLLWDTHKTSYARSKDNPLGKPVFSSHGGRWIFAKHPVREVP